MSPKSRGKTGATDAALTVLDEDGGWMSLNEIHAKVCQKIQCNTDSLRKLLQLQIDRGTVEQKAEDMVFGSRQGTPRPISAKKFYRIRE